MGDILLSPQWHAPSDNAHLGQESSAYRIAPALRVAKATADCWVESEVRRDVRGRGTKTKGPRRIASLLSATSMETNIRDTRAARTIKPSKLTARADSQCRGHA